MGEQAQQLMPGASPEELITALWMAMSAQFGGGIAQQQSHHPPMPMNDDQQQNLSTFWQFLLQIGATETEKDKNDSGIVVDDIGTNTQNGESFQGAALPIA